MSAEEQSAGDEALYAVGRTVMERVGIPKDHWEIAAQLEVLGFRDLDARQRFGCRDVFDAAERIFAMYEGGRLQGVDDVDPAVPKRGEIVRFAGRYLDGLLFSLPMVLQGCTMLLWGYGLWGATDLDVRTGSAIALAFIASYLATGGFSWAIVSRGLFYRYQAEGGMGRWSALRMWSLSARLLIALAIPALFANAAYQLLPMDMAFTAAAYYVAFVLLWLNWSLIYLVEKTGLLLIALLAGTAAVAFVAGGLGLPIVAANLIGLAVADALTFAVAIFGFRNWAPSRAGGATVNPPRLTVLVYATAPMFVYGFCYSAFVFVDRILAWTASRGREDFPPYPFWLNARYELGMDLALIVVVVLAGVVEYSSHRFTSDLIPHEKNVKSDAFEPFLERFRQFYWRHSAIFAAWAVLAVVVARLASVLLRRYPDPRLQASLNSETAIRVFWIAAISYAIFMFGLRNILILLSLSRTTLAIRAIASALAVNVVVGFVASRAIHYSGAVAGLLAGSLVLAVVAHRELRAVLNDLDYYYYAAY